MRDTALAGRHRLVLGPGIRAALRADVPGVRPGRPGRAVRGTTRRGRRRCRGDPARRSQIEVDVVVFASTVPGEPRRILSLGEAKWGDVLGARHVDRLRRARDLLTGRG